jgi:hypothetical protein
VGAAAGAEVTAGPGCEVAGGAVGAAAVVDTKGAGAWFVHAANSATETPEPSSRSVARRLRI